MEHVEQRTPEWDALRRGKVTASKLGDVMSNGTGRTNYRIQLALERITGITQETYCSYAMQVGLEREPDARNAYSFLTGNDVDEVAFCDHPTIPMTGCSPDGLTGSDGLLEIKCPQPAAHWKTIQDNKVPADYLKKLHFQMACSKRIWADYVSYNPEFPKPLDVIVIRVSRDDAVLMKIEPEVRKFLKEVDELEREIRAKMNCKPA